MPDVNHPRLRFLTIISTGDRSDRSVPIFLSSHLTFFTAKATHHIDMVLVSCRIYCIYLAVKSNIYSSICAASGRR